jgi:copper chaperone CopZ
MHLPGVKDVRITGDTVAVSANSSVSVRRVIGAIEGAGGRAHAFSVVPLDVELVRLRVSGMTCGTCAERASRALMSASCVVSADVSYEKSQALVVMERGCSDPTPLIASLSRAGFPSRVEARD